jgi:hypothetical protein
LHFQGYDINALYTGDKFFSLPDRRGLGKAKITDRINRIDKIYIKNPDNPVNPVENRHERFFVSGIEKIH